jgi:DNA polymerase III subunit chi
MPDKIAFYILTEITLKARDLYACRLVEKAYSSKHSVYIHTTSFNDAQNFDTQLWTFRDVSFVPHSLYDPNIESDELVLIGYDATPKIKADVLINLTPDVPKFYEQFNHIIELITNNDEERKTGRKRYQYYQQKSYKIETYDLAKK